MSAFFRSLFSPGLFARTAIDFLSSLKGRAGSPAFLRDGPVFFVDFTR
jgi:hypothetical protein